ncbi:AAA family ATPase [Oleiharenicola lentus]|uniref:AAA family ATPase n=1 Tax=Oleiharenicola lentus TaxID=2508720 RepID=UPI003F66D607
MNDSLQKNLDLLTAARAEVAKVVIGHDKVVELALITILTRQHALLEGVPGVAKTLLVRTLAHVLGAESGRIQFTPDLMPADITGTNIFNLQSNQFTLVRGPVFTTFLLADEINRAPAKTQAALLQAMQERTVTIDRETLALDPNFAVFATQNPAESEGTYPLPEAQKDRFMFRIKMEYPNREDEIILGKRMLGNEAPERALARGVVQSVLTAGQLVSLRESLDTILVRDELMAYVVDLVRATRSDESVLVGAGPRATQALLLGGRAKAALEGRDYVTPDDVRQLAAPVLAHRIVLRPEFEIEGLSVEEVLTRLLEQVAVPR